MATTTLYCECETPVMDVEHDAGCRRCDRPVDFSPREPVSVLKQLNEFEEQAVEQELRVETVAEEADAQPPIVALAAVLDRAREYERSARTYGTPYTDAENLRASVVYLGDLIDKDVERRSS